MSQVEHSVKSISVKVVLYILMGVFALIFAFPFYYMFVLATWSNIYSIPPHMWFGNDLMQNLSDLFVQVPFLTNIINSAGIAILSTCLTIFFCTMGGYAFAKFKFKGRDVLLTFTVATMAIPPFLNIIPFFRMMMGFGWINTWLPLIIPGMASAYGIFLMTQFLEGSIPSDLQDAARIDGLTEFQILMKVVFPLAKSGVAILGTLTFVGSWNNFMGALVMLPDYRKSTIPVALATMSQRSDTSWGGLMAGTCLAVLPLLLIFIFFSKKIIAGLTAGSVKG